MGITASSAPPFSLPRITLIVAIVALAVIPDARGSTNGDNFLGVGAVSRSLGGNGTAAPQDALSAAR